MLLFSGKQKILEYEYLFSSFNVCVKVKILSANQTHLLYGNVCEGILTYIGVHSMTPGVCDYNQYPQMGACQKSCTL